MSKTSAEIENEGPRFSKNWRSHEYWVKYKEKHCSECNQMNEFNTERTNLDSFLKELKRLMDSKNAEILDIGKDVYYLNPETCKMVLMKYSDIKTVRPMELGWLDNKIKELRESIKKTEDILYDLECFKNRMEKRS
jgi:hypothetical protein